MEYEAWVVLSLYQPENYKYPLVGRILHDTAESAHNEAVRQGGIVGHVVWNDEEKATSFLDVPED